MSSDALCPLSLAPCPFSLATALASRSLFLPPVLGRGSGGVAACALPRAQPRSSPRGPTCGPAGSFAGTAAFLAARR